MSSHHDVGVATPPTTETGPLSAFLIAHGLDTSQTLFVTLANKQYIDPIINFNMALKKWNLDRCYVVLCLDVDCTKAAESHNILAYNGFLMTENEVWNDWHVPIARMKVPPHSYFY